MNIKTLLLFFLVVLITSCDESENVIGGSISPPQDNINVFFTNNIGFDAFSFQSPAFRTDGNIKGYDYFMLGGFKPQEIEEATSIKADIAMEFWFDDLEITDGRGDSILVLDSVILLLLQNGYYGDTMALGLLEVFELNTRLSNTRDYFSDENPLDYYDPADKIGELEFQPFDYSVPDSIRNKDGYQHLLRIPIAREVGQRIVDNLDNLNSVEAFREIFSGVYIRTQIGEGALLNIFPFLTTTTSTNFSALNIIYHYESGDTIAESTLQYSQSLICNNECARFNIIRKTQGTYDFGNDSISRKSEHLYLQGLGISNARISLPSLYDRPEFKALTGEDSSRIAVNSARLMLSLDQELQKPDLFLPPSRLLIRRDTIGGYTFIPDEIVFLNNETNYPGGFLTADYTYEFNIAEFVQEIIDSKTETPDDLVISVAGNRNNPGFAFLKGVANDTPLKLEIVYTRY